MSIGIKPRPKRLTSWWRLEGRSWVKWHRKSMLQLRDELHPKETDHQSTPEPDLNFATEPPNDRDSSPSGSEAQEIGTSDSADVSERVRSARDDVRGHCWISFFAFCLWSLLVTQTHPFIQLLEETSTRATVRALNLGQVWLSSAQATSWSKFYNMTLGPQEMGWVSIGHHQWVPSSGLVYPYLMLPFYRLHLLHGLIILAAGLACWSLTVAMGAWVGPRGATAAVVLFLSTGSFAAVSMRVFLSNSVACSLFTISTALLVWLVQPQERILRRDLVAAAVTGITMVVATAVQWSLEFAAVALVVGIAIAMRRGFIRVIIGLSFIASFAFCLLILLSANRGQQHAVFRDMSVDGGTSLSVFWHNLLVQGAQIALGLPLAIVGIWAVVTFMFSSKRQSETSAAGRFLIFFLLSTWFVGFLTVLAEKHWSPAPIEFGSNRWVQYPIVMLIGPLVILGGWLSIYRGFLYGFIVFNVLICGTLL